jgi:hypothetical protein
MANKSSPWNMALDCISESHMHQVNLAIYGNEVNHMAVRVSNALPNTLKDNFNDIKRFKVNLKKFLYIRSFYILDEFLMR